ITFSTIKEVKMSWLDIVIIVVGLGLAILGLSKGLIRMAFSVIGLIGGITLAGIYYESLAEILSSSGDSWAGIAAFAIIVIVTMIVANLVGTLVKKATNLLLLGWIDRALGFILGAIGGGMFCAAVLSIVSKYFPGWGQDVVAQSTMAGLVMERFPLLLGLLPDEFNFISDFFQA
ncbi:MAG: CvpA family protein, partial [Dehalococcoidia bacterium]|nr:CvpA family protein [Dehalococcoidia bacterium]